MNTQQRIDIEQTTEVVCDKCKGTVFIEALKIRKIPGILVGSLQPTYSPIPVFVCVSCNYVNKEFLPKEVAKLE